MTDLTAHLTAYAAENGLGAVLVNVADWTVPSGTEIPEGYAVANAPRPIAGNPAWTGPFRHGVFYAAAGEIPSAWKADDAWLVVFVTNDQLKVIVDAKLAEYQTTLDEVGLTAAELAADLGLPWHEA